MRLQVQFILISEISCCCVGTRIDHLSACKSLNLPFITLLISALPLPRAYYLGLVLASPGGGQRGKGREKGGRGSPHFSVRSSAAGACCQ